MNKYFAEEREELLEIEERIIRMTGSDPDGVNLELFDSSVFGPKINELLSQRCDVLNAMFICSDQELEAFKKVNDKFHSVVEHIEKKVQKVKELEEFDLQGHCHLDVETRLCVPYSSEKSINTMDNDSEYGSNFSLMNCILDRYYQSFYQDNIDKQMAEWIKPGTDAYLGPFEDCRFDGIDICYPMIGLAYNKYYSVPDIVRLNNIVSHIRVCGQDTLITHVK